MPTFTVDGVEYPTLEDDLTLDEAGWFYDIAGVGVEAIGEEDQGDKLKKAKALMCLSIARVKPDVPHAEIEKRIGSLKITELADVFADTAGQSPPSASESVEPSEPSGEPSNDDSDASPAEADPLPTGSPPSEDPAGSDRPTSVDLRRVS